MQFRDAQAAARSGVPGVRHAPTITELIDYEQFCGIRKAAAEARANAVPEITPAELAARLERGDDLDLIDVREPHEWEIARIPGARAGPARYARRSASLARPHARHRGPLQGRRPQRQSRPPTSGCRLPERDESGGRNHGMERGCGSGSAEVLS